MYNIVELLDNTPKNRIFITTDWHVFSYKYGKGKNQVNIKDIVSWCKNNIKEDDVYINLGDLCYKDANKKDLDAAKEIYKSLPGKKILVLGNHDILSGEDFYKNCGFDVIVDRIDYHDICMTHKPIKVETEPLINLNIHGHKHDETIYNITNGENSVNAHPLFFGNKPVTLKYILDNKDKLTKNNIMDPMQMPYMENYILDETISELASKFFIGNQSYFIESEDMDYDKNDNSLMVIKDNKLSIIQPDEINSCIASSKRYIDDLEVEPFNSIEDALCKAPNNNTGLYYIFSIDGQRKICLGVVRKINECDFTWEVQYPVSIENGKFKSIPVDEATALSTMNPIKGLVKPYLIRTHDNNGIKSLYLTDNILSDKFIGVEDGRLNIIPLEDIKESYIEDIYTINCNDTAIEKIKKKFEDKEIVDKSYLYTVFSGKPLLTTDQMDFEPEIFDKINLETMKIQAVLPVALNYDEIMNKYHPDKLYESTNAVVNNRRRRDDMITGNKLFTPYFTDEERSLFNGYYSDDIVEDSNFEFNPIFETTYRAKRDDENLTSSWINNIYKLQDRLKSTTDPDEINRIKQTMIHLGWNPEVEYNAVNANVASIRLSTLLNNDNHEYEFVDCTNYIDTLPERDYINESEQKQKLYPVYIVFVKGETIISNIISKATHGDFSHVGISLDTSMKNIYSYNMNNGVRIKGGFSLEDIKKYPKENRFSVYTIFVTEWQYYNIKKNIDIMIKDIKKTKYSLINFITLPLNKIKINMSKSMICSQFIDHLLKLSNIDLTDKDSSKVSPNGLYYKIRYNTKVYSVFDGIVKDYNENKVNKFINSLYPRANPIKEGFVIDLTYLNEARSLPIEIKDNGDILITNPYPNYKEEFYASHKLLIEYDKANNIEGIKYELARLYYMNYIIEKKLYHNKNLDNKNELIKVRAVVLNDFKKYIKVIQKKEPDFIFSSYYEQSPFYPHTIEIKKSTIGKMKDIIKYIL